MRILVAQLNPTIGDLEGNARKISRVLEEAQRDKVDIVQFPEMAICGYPPEDLLMHDDFVLSVEKTLTGLLPKTRGLFVVIGLVRHSESKGEKFLCNSAAVIHDGKLLGYHDKWLLPTYDVFDERRYFEPGTTVKVWDFKGKKIGVLICEDIWQHAGDVDFTKYACDPVNELALLKPDVLLVINASPYRFQKREIRVHVCAASAKTLKCPVIFCCQVGGNDQLVFDGYSMHVDKQGQLVQLAKGFEEDMMLVDLNAPSSVCTFNYDPLHDLCHALILGTRDYFHKQGFTKGCLGVSGGVDSALTAYIGVQALGAENVLGLLMPSRYSSEGSVTDALALAKNLGIKTHTISIEGPFSEHLKLLTPYFQGKAPDTTEENLQSRTRGTILMALANKLGYLVLSTGNKSEMALGYCTLYGDMAGGLSVLADVSKTQVYALAHWINRNQEIIPRSSIEKPPSAELKPNQKDTDTLPEFDVLDHILQGYVEDCLSPEEIAKVNQLPLSLVKEIIHKIHLAEYKRRQAAPGIRVTKKAFRVGRRYPIVQKWM